MEREVAIKVMRAEAGANGKAVAHWLQEARSVGRVSHPNIGPVYEADIQDQQPYLVLEYVSGSTLDQVLTTRGALPPREAVVLARCSCGGSHRGCYSSRSETLQYLD